jgi:hypothetical protein
MECVELATTGLGYAFDVTTQCKRMTMLTLTGSEYSTALTHVHAY